PRAGLREVHGEGADREEERAEPEPVERHRRRAERRVARGRDPAEQPEEERADARRRNETAHEAEQERPAIAGSADARQTIVQALGERDLERTEEGGGEREEDNGDTADHPWIAERAAEALARHGGGNAHRREEANDARHEHRREHDSLKAALGLLGAEDRDRDRDHG